MYFVVISFASFSAHIYFGALLRWIKEGVNSKKNRHLPVITSKYRIYCFCILVGVAAPSTMDFAPIAIALIISVIFARSRVVISSDGLW